MQPIRSRKVRRMLRLEGQAARLRARQERAGARPELFRRRADACLTEARAIEASLTGSQLGELRRARTTTPTELKKEDEPCRA
jgi:hypothetical protein